jgi:hypothetical protein
MISVQFHKQVSSDKCWEVQVAHTQFVLSAHYFVDKLTTTLDAKVMIYTVHINTRKVNGMIKKKLIFSLYIIFSPQHTMQLYQLLLN